jgi:hypothetical protein
MKAMVRLSDGWHMLNQARLALIEAQACTIFYTEIQKNRPEALYHCRYYLDDAALRLCSSCEHMVQFVILHWHLAITKGADPNGPNSSSTAQREGSLVLALKAAERRNNAQVPTEVVKILRALRSSKAWRACVQHRHDWVHNRLPATSGLHPEIRFETTRNLKGIPPKILKHLPSASGQKYAWVSFGMGSDISVFHETMRNAYGDLFRGYEGLAKLLAQPDTVGVSKKGRSNEGA